MGNDTILEAISKGNIKDTMQVGGKLSHVTITQVLHVPKWIIVSFLWVNSFSKVSKWSFTRMVLRLATLKELLWQKHEGTRICTFLMWRCARTTHIANSSDESAMFWHEIFDHLNMASLKELDVMVDGMNLKEVLLHHICERCIKSKHQFHHFPRREQWRLHNFWRLSTLMCMG